MREVERWQKRIILLKVSTGVILVTAVLSMLIIWLTYYGENVGNFIITVSRNDQKQIAISTDKEFGEKSVYLSAEGIKDATNITYKNLPLNEIKNWDGGSHNDQYGKLWLGYTFYLKNMSVYELKYKMDITIKDSYKGVDKAIRLMMITGETQTIYAAPKPDGSNEDHSNLPIGGYNTIPFFNEHTVTDGNVYDMTKDEVHKYTIVMWLEGEDVDCTDAIREGAIRMEMHFSVIN
ncbi:MAG: hypothetical protein RR054_05180 [Clostridia bacterium]